MVEDSRHENLRSIRNIDKIIVIVGTNDVKFYNPRVRYILSKDLKRKIITLVKVLKQLYIPLRLHMKFIFRLCSLLG